MIDFDDDGGATTAAKDFALVHTGGVPGGTPPPDLPLVALTVDVTDELTTDGDVVMTDDVFDVTCDDNVLVTESDIPTARPKSPR